MMKPYLLNMYIISPLPGQGIRPKYNIHTCFMYIPDGTTLATNYACLHMDLDIFLYKHT